MPTITFIYLNTKSTSKKKQYWTAQLLIYKISHEKKSETIVLGGAVQKIILRAANLRHLRHINPKLKPSNNNVCASINDKNNLYTNLSKTNCKAWKHLNEKFRFGLNNIQISCLKRYIIFFFKYEFFYLNFWRWGIHIIEYIYIYIHSVINVVNNEPYCSHIRL